MPSPAKGSTPKTPLPRTPRSKWKGDVLGKNKIQKSITSYFKLDAPIVSQPEEDRVQERIVRKVQFKVKNMPACTPVVSADTITISDDEGWEQSNIENYHVKRKNSSAGTIKKRNISPARKSHKLKTLNDVSAESVDSDADTPSELPKPSTSVFGSAEDELNGVSPRKRFRKQSLKVNTSDVEPNDGSFKNLKDSTETIVPPLKTEDLVYQDETIVISSTECSLNLEDDESTLNKTERNTCNRPSVIIGIKSCGSKNPKDSTYVSNTNPKLKTELPSQPVGTEGTSRLCEAKTRGVSQASMSSRVDSGDEYVFNMNKNLGTFSVPATIPVRVEAEASIAADITGLAEMDWSPMEEETKLSSPMKNVTFRSTNPRIATSNPCLTSSSVPSSDGQSKSSTQNTLANASGSTQKSSSAIFKATPPQTPTNSRSGPSPMKSPLKRLEMGSPRKPTNSTPTKAGTSPPGTSSPMKSPIKNLEMGSPRKPTNSTPTKAGTSPPGTSSPMKSPVKRLEMGSPRKPTNSTPTKAGTSPPGTSSPMKSPVKRLEMGSPRKPTNSTPTKAGTSPPGTSSPMKSPVKRLEMGSPRKPTNSTPTKAGTSPPGTSSPMKSPVKRLEMGSPRKPTNSTTKAGTSPPGTSSPMKSPIKRLEMGSPRKPTNSTTKAGTSPPGTSSPMKSPIVMGSLRKPNDPTFTVTPLTPTKPGSSRSGPSTPKKSPYKSPKKGSPQKSLRKYDGEAMSGNVALEHSILECKRYAQLALSLNSSNQKVANEYLSLDLYEKVLLHKLLVKKWSWIRDVDMKYEKIVQNLIGSLDALRDKGFLEDLSDDEPLEVILGQLKRPELETLSEKYEINSSGSKKDDLVNSLCNFVNLQGGLGFSSQSLKTLSPKTALSIVGKCVRIRKDTRGILQKIFEASMSPLYLEGQFYSFQQRLAAMEKLMNEVKFKGKKLVPFVLDDYQLFLSPAQFDEYITSVILKFEMLSAKDEKNQARGLKLTKEARASLMIYLYNPKVKEFLEKSPRYVWRYTAGSNYTSAMTVGIEFLKRAKEYDDAVTTIGVLLGQQHFRKHCRGHWYAEKVMIMDKQLKRPAEELYEVLLTGLEEDLTLIGRLELSKKAEGIINKRKNGLTADQKKKISSLMRKPRLNHSSKEIRSTEAPNVSTGTRQTFVEFSGLGERKYLNVEEVARNSYMSEFPEGLHDKGDFIKNIILAAFWPVIYMSKENMFVSKFQNAPLDWGTQAFYRNRRNDIEDHILKFRATGIDGVMQQITQVVTDYANYHSVIEWFYVNFDKLPLIKNILSCLTLDKFLKLSEYLLESYCERRSGWPDLTLWNTVASTFKLVEVNSPNDEHSFKQIVWLEKFVEFGIDVEECRVNAANKGKKRKAVDGFVTSDASQEVM
ncbi:hypothetical protein GE061_003563 [Apolygus lucorum]|uniref:Fanconi-associated nuclease n=1 Tax=Apolygus lucorum TaxID=248454 RepID=A0A8S9X2E3_APOLU|nr:hypothetical protein GE061_003563 [Apolygus lucorum]